MIDLNNAEIQAVKALLRLREPGNEALLVIIQGKYKGTHKLYSQIASLLVGRQVLGYIYRSIQRLL